MTVLYVSTCVLRPPPPVCAQHRRHIGLHKPPAPSLPCYSYASACFGGKDKVLIVSISSPDGPSDTPLTGLFLFYSLWTPCCSLIFCLKCSPIDTYSSPLSFRCCLQPPSTPPSYLLLYLAPFPVFVLFCFIGFCLFIF